MNYEIQDDNGAIFSGDFAEMLLAWNVNYLPDRTFKQFYGLSKDFYCKKYGLTGWTGNLKLTVVMHSIHASKRNN